MSNLPVQGAAEGQPIHQGFRYERASIGTMDPRNAMAMALRDYLAGLVFVRAGLDVPDREFALEDVVPNWPDPSQSLNFPAASVIDVADAVFEAHNFVPTALDDTFEVFGKCTVLWKTSEAVELFQVDFWANEDATREAIMARLPQAFNPDEVRSGVIVQGPERYFCRPVRLSLLTYRRFDTPEDVFQRERRVSARVQAEMDVVHLRDIKPLQVQTVVDVTDQPVLGGC